MANSFSADFPEIWSRVQQQQFFKETVAVAIADVSAKSQMSVGDTFNKPYRSSNSVQTYTRGTSINIDDKTDTQEQLVVNNQYATGFYIDDMDSIQSNYDLIASYAKDDTDLLNIQIDGDVLGEYSNAVSSVDAGDVGGTAGLPVVLTTSNVSAVFGAAHSKLAKQNVALKNKFAVLSPEFENILVQYGAGRDTNSGDSVQNNGFIGKFYGFDLYMSNNLSGEVLITIDTEPTAADTLVLDGITFEFVAAPATAGQIDLSGTVDTTVGYLVNLINNPSTTSATQIALSTDDARRVSRNWTATQDAGNDTVTVVAKGVGRLVASETFTAGTNVITKEIQHNLMGIKGNISLVIQKSPMPKVKDVETKMGSNILNAILYGVKTFNDGAKQLVDVQIDSTSFSAGASNI
jgi:hypothetical protein